MSTLRWDDQRLRAAVQAAMDDALAEAARTCADECVVRFGSQHGGVPSAPGAYPHSQSGRLRGSIVYVHPRTAGTPGRAYYGTNVRYGRVLQFGATIYPKRVKALPVPVNKPARKMLEKASVSGGLRSFKLTLIKSGSQAMLVETTKGGRVRKGGAAFVLKKSVKIAPRPWINLPGSKSYLAAAQANARAQFAASLNKHLSGGAS